MNVFPQKLILVTLFLIGLNASATSIELCLASAKKKTHVIDQHSAIEDCFQENLNQLTLQKCFSLVKEIDKNKKFYDLGETLNTMCFYSTSPFNSIKSCIAGTSKFKTADSHDEAVFDCYRQFQTELSQKQCIEVSRKLIYPAKKDYLFQHCQNNP